ncbi:MAG: ATPase domain-containing protein, partial [Cyanobacteria bacterium J06639_1]
AQIVMLDSVTGFNLTMQDEDFASRLHALCKYLANMGVTVILINQVNDLSGTFQDTGTNITYLADNLISLQYVERLVNGKVELRKAIGVVKKRLSDFEKTLRELEITRYGLKVSQPIEGLQGILGGSLPVDEE